MNEPFDFQELMFLKFPQAQSARLPSAITVGTVGFADASTHCLLRLTRSGHFRFQRTAHWAAVSLAPLLLMERNVFSS